MNKLTVGLGATTATAGLLLAGSTVLGDAANAAPGPELTCGAVVSTDVILRRDLFCAGDGITVIASGVRVDLRGHRLSGDGSGTAIKVRTDDANPVIITRGKIADFDRGISPDGGAAVRLTALQVERTSAAFYGRDDWSSLSVTDSRFRDNGVAIVAVGPGRPLGVTGSRFERNGSGVQLKDVFGATVIDSVFTNNNRGFFTFQSDGHTLERNTFTRNEEAIDLNQSRRNHVSSNRLEANVTGLSLQGTESQANVITGNRFLDNEACGAIIGDGRFGVVPKTRIDSNLFRGNGAAGLWFQGAPSSNGSTITNNRFVSNGFAPGALVDEQGAPLDDGLHVFNPASAGSVTLTGNTAVGNAGHGIQAAFVVNGGNNRERRNGAGPGFVR